MNFEDYKFMSIGSNCVFLACLDKSVRLRGPVDNTSLKSVNGLKLVVEDKLYDFIKNTTPTKRHKNENEYKKGDCEWETAYPDKTLSFVHNIPEGEHFFNNFKLRCQALADFIPKAKTDNKYWLIFTLNGNFVKYNTGELIMNNLEEVLAYLKETGLLSKTIIIGSRVINSDYKVFDHHLNRESFNHIKNTFKTLNYIELNDVNA